MIDCIIHLLLMTLHSEGLPYQTLSYFVYRCTVIFSKSSFLFYQPSVEAISCVQKCKKHVKTWLRQTFKNVRLSFVFTRTGIKTNRPHASQICIGVIIDLSIKTQSLCDILIGRELNEITPTAIGRLDILWQTLGHRISSDLLIFCGGSQIWTPAVLFRFFKEFETCQQKKNWRKLESPAENVRVQNKKLAKKYAWFSVSENSGSVVKILDLCHS